ALPDAAPAETLVLLQGPTRLSACRPTTGEEVWYLERENDPIASSVVRAKTLYLPSQKGLTALELQPTPHPPKVLWEAPKLGPTMASPLVLGERVHGLRGAVLVSGDVRTGAVTGQLRLQGPFSASPVAAAGLLYCVNENGQVQVVRPDDKDGKLLASNA